MSMPWQLRRSTAVRSFARLESCLYKNVMPVARVVRQGPAVAAGNCLRQTCLRAVRQSETYRVETGFIGNGNESSHGRDDFAGHYDDRLPQGGG